MGPARQPVCSAAAVKCPGATVSGYSVQQPVRGRVTPCQGFVNRLWHTRPTGNSGPVAQLVRAGGS